MRIFDCRYISAETHCDYLNLHFFDKQSYFVITLESLWSSTLLISPQRLFLLHFFVFYISALVAKISKKGIFEDHLTNCR